MVRWFTALCCMIAASTANAQVLGSLQATPAVFGRPVSFSVSGPPRLATEYFVSAAGLSSPIVVPSGRIWLDPSAGVSSLGAFAAPGPQTLTLALPASLPGASPEFFLQAVQYDPTLPTGAQTTAPLRTRIATANSFAATPIAMTIPRAFATSTRLLDGRVLIVGGGDASPGAPLGTTAVDLYDPFTQSLAPTAPLATSRGLHTAVRLSDGRVLVAGGVQAGTYAVTPTAEIYDPMTGSWSNAATMNVPRAAHAMTLLPDGRVLVVGGTAQTFNLAAATALGFLFNLAHNTGEVYDPVLDTWTMVLNVMQTRRVFTGVEMIQTGPAAGLALVVGGISGASRVNLCVNLGVFGEWCVFGSSLRQIDYPTFTATCEYYDPMSNAFGPAPSLPAISGLSAGRGVFGIAPVRTALGQRRIAVAGGVSTGFTALAFIGLNYPRVTAATATFDELTTTWSSGPQLASAVALPAMMPLTDGRALIAGGLFVDLLTGLSMGATALADVQLFDGVALTRGAAMPYAVGGAHPALLPDGSAFLAGGFITPIPTAIPPTSATITYVP